MVRPSWASTQYVAVQAAVLRPSFLVPADCRVPPVARRWIPWHQQHRQQQRQDRSQEGQANHEASRNCPAEEAVGEQCVEAGRHAGHRGDREKHMRSWSKYEKSSGSREMCAACSTAPTSTWLATGRPPDKPAPWHAKNAAVNRASGISVAMCGRC